ncbi:hypothetical protein BDW02DRAFT_303345 [Decorospora gaudefroyi]|uniref:Uncharacterized protein n=1 Tax=Decorospora gaudefroyi TaxID=184978 RepID=A0A6A5KUA3_9PLEO|nr:hypothetical protein BDW02DRAFT_303345 [Decorospora gaudefroyi]
MQPVLALQICAAHFESIVHAPPCPRHTETLCETRRVSCFVPVSPVLMNRPAALRHVQCKSNFGQQGQATSRTCGGTAAATSWHYLGNQQCLRLKATLHPAVRAVSSLDSLQSSRRSVDFVAFEHWQETLGRNNPKRCRTTSVGRHHLPLPKPDRIRGLPGAPAPDHHTSPRRGVGNLPLPCKATVIRELSSAAANTCHFFLSTTLVNADDLFQRRLPSLAAAISASAVLL